MVGKVNILVVHLLVALLLLAFGCGRAQTAHQNVGQFDGYHFAQPTGYVSDLVQLFSKAQADTLTEIIVGYEKETTNQIAVVALRDSVITSANFKDYVTGLYNNWGIGTKEKNNGVLICIVPDMRMLRISNGYGIVNKLTDEETAKIIDDIMVPAFKKGNYYLGTKNALLAIMQKIK